MEGADERSATILARKPLELNRELNPPYAGHRHAAELKYRAAGGSDSSEAAIRCFNSRYTKFASRGCGRPSPVVIPGRAARTRVHPCSSLSIVQVGNSRLGGREPGIHDHHREYGFRARDSRTKLTQSVNFVSTSRPGMTTFIVGSHRHLPVQHRPACGQAFGGVDDGVGVDAVVAVEIADGAGLAEMFDAERLDAMAAHAAEPAERRRMAVEHG